MRKIDTFLHTTIAIAIGAIVIAGTVAGRRQYLLLQTLQKLKTRRQQLEENLRTFTERKPGLQEFTGDTEQRVEFVLSLKEKLLNEVTYSARKRLKNVQKVIQSFRYKEGLFSMREAEAAISQLEGEFAELLTSFEEIYSKLKVNDEFVGQIHFLLKKAESEFIVEQRMYSISFPFLADQLSSAVESYKMACKTIMDNDPLRAHDLLIKADDIVTSLSDHIEQMPRLLEKVQVGMPQKLKELEDSISAIHSDGYKMKEKPPEQLLHEAYDILYSLLPLWREGRIRDVILGLEKIQELRAEVLNLFSEQHRLVDTIPQLLKKLPQQLAELHEDDPRVQTQLAQLKRDYVVKEDELFLYFTDLEEMDVAVARLIREAEACGTEQNFILAEEKLLLAQKYVGILQERKKEIQTQLSGFVATEEEIKSSLEFERKELMKLYGRIEQSVINGVPAQLAGDLEELEEALSDAETVLESRPLNTVALPSKMELISSKRQTLEKTIGQMIYAADLAHEEMMRAERYRNKNAITSMKWKDAEVAFDNFMFKEAFELAADVNREGMENGEPASMNGNPTLSRRGRKKTEKEKEKVI